MTHSLSDYICNAPAGKTQQTPTAKVSSAKVKINVQAIRWVEKFLLKAHNTRTCETAQTKSLDVCEMEM